MSSLRDKGLTYEQCAAEHPIAFGRPRPAVPFSASREPGRKGSISRQSLPVQLLEEAGCARASTPVTFGLPLPKGGLFALEHIRLLSPDGKEVPAQFTATAFWPDNSLKWVLVDFTAPLAAREAATYTIEFGSDVTRGPQSSRLRIEDGKDAILVDTGAIRVSMDKRRFNLFFRVEAGGRLLGASAPEGLRLVDESGRLFTLSATPPGSMTVEQTGPRKVVVRAAGDYADGAGSTYMSYVTRLIFQEGSSQVTVEHTHINTYLKAEFTDITSLSLPMRLGGAILRAHAYWDAGDHAGRFSSSTAQIERTGDIADQGEFSVSQWDERSFALRDQQGSADGRQYSGVLRLESDGGALGVAAHEFWQRWPKAFRANRQEISVELLPAQPGAGYGSDLPDSLNYPFVGGKYRFKWGMAFTQRVTFDFAGTAPAAELAADADLPVAAVLPAEWYASTAALGMMAVPGEGRFARWDEAVAKAFQGHMQRKAQTREYGYFNYGDWYGEREINWGNNEYDLAHCLFLQFARTGRRDYLRLAPAAARHQADVDTVHAYPDPQYLGAELSHAVGHTGSWEEDIGTWSKQYDVWQYTARSGHVWADGMMEAWYLTGDAWVMEACLGLGEHIVWSMSQTFTEMGTHERDAGWAIAAVIAIYRGTYDPVYLEAARRIVSVALRTQRFDEGGAWPHVLPSDHADQDHQGVIGNNLFLIGILLSGLKDFHEETGDPAVARSLIAGARWVLLSWDEKAKAWPYSASVTGEPVYQRYVALNNLICESLPYAGELTGERRFFDVAERALAATLDSDLPSWGKSLAQYLHFAPTTMGMLQHWRGSAKDP